MRSISVELRRYSAMLRGVRRLDRDEERATVLRAQKGDAAARDLLVRNSLAFVIRMALRMRLGSISIHDAIQEGSLGILRAIETFDVRRGTKFLTYGHWWARAYMTQLVNRDRSSVRPPGRSVALEDFSLDAPLATDDDGEDTHLDVLEHPGPSPHEVFVSFEERERIRSRLARLKGALGPVGWEVVHLRLASDSPATLETIGQRLGVTREWVRQREIQVKGLLRKHLRSEEAA